ncbi:hypothetical protein SSPSH_002558 [Salinisphaera shabanensis E1L3A]|uniref:Uncharacterized protein n=1 Tax=Salinisphaera shabanensis E1L3A TaxID=1033802 RepID=U2EJK0_9GAMM|nr:hypothetical protein SSPSH_002558 [Salinisphaera shabanensis E1L3A]
MYSLQAENGLAHLYGRFIVGFARSDPLGAV